MNNYQRIEDVSERLANEFDWPHSFIRECYITTSHTMCEFVDNSGEVQLGDVDGPRNVRLIVACAGNAIDVGIEFIFRDVSIFSLQAFDELQFTCNCQGTSGYSVHFTNATESRECYIYAKMVLVKFLGRKYLGIDQLLGFELPTSDACGAETVEGCWRQCSNCSNAWEENPKTEFSRCPDCGKVTRLKK